MPITVTTCGAAGEVTGSGYLVRTPRASVLVDFGFFQGSHDADQRNASIAPVDPARLNAVVVTHAHLDHIGRLPMLAAAGYRGPIWCTPATRDLALIMLEDAARIQEQDAAHENRERARKGITGPPVAPIYGQPEIALLAPLFRTMLLEQPQDLAPGIRVRLFEAGHILGSASVEMAVEEGRGEETESRRDEVSADEAVLTSSLGLSVSSSLSRTLTFSGDIGQRETPILRDPILPTPPADMIFMESTYGDRDHRSQEDTVRAFHDLLKAAVWDKRRILIPSFAIGRTQVVLYHIAAARREGVIPEIPVYLDSPLADKATQVYTQHQELYDIEATDLAKRHVLQEQLAQLHVLKSVDESRALNDNWDPCIIIAGSGMCDGGRIVHHLKHSIWRRNVSVILTGYQAQGTLGRRLADGAREVYIFGDKIPVRADIHTIGGFSAHAGQTQLLEWLAKVAAPDAAQRPRIVLTHGEEPQRAALAAKIRERFGIDAVLPRLSDIIEA